MAKNRKTIIVDIKFQEKGIKTSINSTSKSLDGLTSSTKKASKAQAEFNKELDKGKTSAGLAGAIVTEFGRTVSDLPYGMRGIGNNLSQLASLFGLFAANARTSGISMKEAFSELKGQFLGPIGIITLVQILIAALQSEKIMSFIDSLSSMSKQLKILSGLTKSAAQNAESLVGNFKMYTSIITNANESEEQRAIALKKLNDEYPDFNSNILTEAENTKEATLAIDEYTKALKRRALSQAAEDEFRKVSGEIIAAELKREQELQKEREDFLDKSNRAIVKQELSTGQAIMVSQEEKSKAYVDSVDEINKAADAEIAKQQEKLDFLITLIDVENNENKKIVKDRNRVFKEGDLDFQKEIQQSSERELKTFIEREKGITSIRFQGIKDRARLKVQEFEEDQARRLEDFKKRGATNEQILDAQKKYDNSIRIANEELSQYIIQLNEEEKAALGKIDEEHNNKILQMAYQRQVSEAQLIDMQSSFPALFAEEETRVKQKQFEFEIRLQRGIVNAHKEGTIERANAEKRLVELQKQYAQEKISFDQQRFDQIKHMYGEFSASVGFISEAIKNKELKDAGESEEAREKALKKAFKVQKAMKIAQVVMDTYEAGFKAYGSQLIIGDPSSLVRAQIARALTIAKGIAQVAAISSTQFGSKNVSSGGGSKVQVEAPDFNVVGQSPESQLAQTVAGQQSKPLKAFVVGKEITSQQELDRNITTNASLGD